MGVVVEMLRISSIFYLHLIKYLVTIYAIYLFALLWSDLEECYVCMPWCNFFPHGWFCFFSYIFSVKACKVKRLVHVYLDMQ
jgi:hypothetical protein